MLKEALEIYTNKIILQEGILFSYLNTTRRLQPIEVGDELWYNANDAKAS